MNPPEKDQDQELSWLDRKLLRAATSFEDGWPRRSFLRRLGTIVLGALGVTILTREMPLPVLTGTGTKGVGKGGQTVHAQAQCNCNYWAACGLYGRLCCETNCTYPPCCGVCPPGTLETPNSWTYCCYDYISGFLRRLIYYDCCDPNSQSLCPDCPWCPNNPTPQPDWCYSDFGYQYTCTGIGWTEDRC